MKVIDLLNGIANGRYHEIRTKFIENDETFNMQTFKNNYVLDEGVLNLEIKLLDKEDEFISIYQKNRVLRTDDLIPPIDENLEKIWKNVIMNHNDIQDLIKNQNLIIKKLKEKE